MFTLALMFAGLRSYGQDPNYIPATECTPALPLGDCADDDELHPLPGKTYTYTIGVTPAVGSNTTDPGYVQWFVYDATTYGDAIIDAGVLTTDIEPNDGSSKFLLSAETAKYNSITNEDVSIDISWHPFDAFTNEILLVAYVMGEDGCADNIEVWRIEPAFSFTLDIAGLMPDGSLPASGNANECVSPVQDATYDGVNLTMDYGENYVFFTVTAANFVHSWKPTFAVTSTGTSVELADVSWAYPDEAIKADANGVANGTWNAHDAPVIAQGGDAVGAEGECIIVRVYLDHGNVENDVASAVTLTVDGVMYDVSAATGAEYDNTALLSDLDPNDAGDCIVGSNDSATYDLTPRPNITEVKPTTADGPFEPKN